MSDFPSVHREYTSQIGFDINKAIRYLSSAESRLNDAIREADEYLRKVENAPESIYFQALRLRDELIDTRNELVDIAKKLANIYVSLKPKPISRPGIFPPPKFFGTD
jgi:DNA-directed RNA polymerase subunit F